MRQANKGDNVRVHYTLKLDDGTVFDSSRDREPLEFSIGKRQVIKGFEDAVIGMTVGGSKTIKIPFMDAYGPYREDLVLRLKRSQLPSHIELREGLHLQLTQPDGTIVNVVVTDISEDTVTLDANYPLAGKDLTFEIELVEIL
jgi:peptidylprolyl isomerase